MDTTSDAQTVAQPNWWSSALLPHRLLHKFLDQLDAGRRPYLKVNSKSVPELYDFLAREQDYLWALLQELDNKYHIVSIQRAKTNPYDQPYEGAKIYFMADQEPLVRRWLNRPAQTPYALIWAQELARLQHQFDDAGAALEHRHLQVKGMSAAQVVKAFASIPEQLQQPITLRALSARCFSGDSKFLDPHEQLIRELFPSLAGNLRARPVMLTVHLARSPKQLLFVENQDTFLTLAKADLATVTLVYSAGFRGSAPRVREPGQVEFAYLNAGRNTEYFTQAWFNRDTDTLPAYFWGDLDYAGMSILKALRQSFTGLTAWQPGYAPLLERLNKGLSHHQDSGVKNNQSVPELTGCHYTDTVLLPAIKQAQSFVDQEAVLITELTIEPKL